MNAATTVREVVVENPQTTRIFEKYKIDYCCGGNTPLVEACEKAGVEFQEIQKLLTEIATPVDTDTVDFNQMTLTELIGHILAKHHVYTNDEMVRLDALLTKVVSVHGSNHPELNQVRELFQNLCADLAPHMLKEEQILFPYIVQVERAATNKQSPPFAPFGTVNNPVHRMMMEHDAAGEILREIRKATSDFRVPEDVCISYKTLYEALEAFEKDLHQHIHLENNILFPRAIKMERMFTA